MASRFLERLSDGPPIVADGGMGALLLSAIPRLRCPEEANLRAPETVLSLHLSFIRAGAELIETNTFGANRRKLASNYLEEELYAINHAAVKLAREAREVSGKEVLIAGSIGPLGEVDVASPRVRAGYFAEQAEILEGRGIDLFAVETFYDLDELVTAVEAVRGASGLPIVAMLTFDEDAETLGGVRARDALERLRELDVAAVGANCGAGPAAALNALHEMGADGLPLVALPNIGLAGRVGGRVVYPNSTPDYFAEFAALARRLGARVIGGCCGTTPAQIGAIAGALAEEREPTSEPFLFTTRDLPRAGGAAEEETRLARALRENEFVVSLELDPPKGGNDEGLLQVARTMKESEHVGFVDINDNPMARARMSALMAAVAIERLVGIETIPHVTPRDATVMGLESQLLGAHAAGVRNVLAVTGDPPTVGDYPGSHGVYEVDSIGLCQIVARLNAGVDYNGKAIDAPTSFFVGVAVNPSAENLDEELRRFERKLAEGARFAMTQALFDLSYLDAFLAGLGGSCPIPLLVGLWPLRSHALAVRLHNEVPGIVVPEPVQERLRLAGSDAAAAGLDIARELLAEAREKAAGVYVVPPFKQPEAALELFA